MVFRDTPLPLGVSYQFRHRSSSLVCPVALACVTALFFVDQEVSRSRSINRVIHTVFRWPIPIQRKGIRNGRKRSLAADYALLCQDLGVLEGSLSQFEFSASAMSTQTFSPVSSVFQELQDTTVIRLPRLWASMSVSLVP